MRITDSHCHLNRIPHQVGRVEEIIQQAAELDVTRMLCVAISPDRWDEVIELAERFDNVYATVGIHPTTDAAVVLDETRLCELAQHPKVIAVGEIGLDYFHHKPDKEDLTWMVERFRRQIQLAKAVNLPVIIHTRESTPDLLDILEEEGAETVGGIMHCFVDDLASAQRAMDMGFYISFSGILTFNSAKALQEVAKAIPADRLLVETDSPYLAPVPYRGKVNQPGYTRYVVEKLAQLRGETPEAIAEQTWQNFNRLFGLSD
ncbi:MAG TPA: TatD family deoxyribonuclease [Piscirickettsiaceae bacterium]|nr:TatD family deoxyribonuclease [Piscirickettsiaceae bacterium]HIQ40567.1 TatD family deoxyribonuclease [Sulfurivirga caldicuralii]